MLDRINTPYDVKSLTSEEKTELSREIREALIENVSQTGGHLASNLGTVELTVSLLSVFDLEKDKIVWDVGHQAYTFKLLTGRKEEFSTLRKKGGISGFPYPPENKYDSFIAGHSSVSVSAAYGLLKANALSGNDGKVIAVIGDGALGGGEAYEGLNNAGADGNGLIVILNDNGMSISKNVGHIATYLTKIRNRKSYFSAKSLLSRILNKIPLIGKPLLGFLTKIKFMLKYSIYRNSTMFEDLGFTYLGPANGNDIKEVEKLLVRAKEINEPCLIHLKTVKGKGYERAEDNPSLYHGVGSFSVSEGALEKSGESYTEAFACALLTEAEKNTDVLAITAAMEDGTGLSEFKKRFPERFFDVGIAEEHAVTFSAALAHGGKRPVFCVYSTFLQRALDQLIHDCSILNENLVIAIDRAGIVPGDGVTHQGIYDTVYLKSVPNITVYSPSSYFETEEALQKALSVKGLTAVRYPKGKAQKADLKSFAEGESHKIKKSGGKILLVTYGRELFEVIKAADKLKEKGIICDLLKLDKIIPLKREADLSGYDTVFFIEEGYKIGGIGESFIAAYPEIKSFIHKAIEKPLMHGTVSELLSEAGLDCDSIVKTVTEVIK